jgi:hypothetical protein
LSGADSIRSLYGLMAAGRLDDAAAALDPDPADAFAAVGLERPA